MNAQQKEDYCDLGIYIRIYEETMEKNREMMMNALRYQDTAPKTEKQMDKNMKIDITILYHTILFHNVYDNVYQVWSLRATVPPGCAIPSCFSSREEGNA